MQHHAQVPEHMYKTHYNLLINIEAYSIKGTMHLLRRQSFQQ